MFGPVRGRWKDGCRCGLRGWPPDGGAQRVFRERAAVECRAPAAEADVRHLRGAAVGWRTEGSGRCVVGAGRVLECRASGVVPRTGGAGSSGSRAGVGPVRAGADRWARRGPAWTLCSGEAGMEPLPFPNGAGRIPRTEPLFRRGPSVQAGPVASPYGSPPFPDGPVASPGRKASHLRAQRPPEGARCSVFGLFLFFSAASRRAGTDAVCKSAVSPLGKSEKVVFLFLLYN